MNFYRPICTLLLVIVLAGCAQAETPTAMSLALACTPDAEVEFLRRPLVVEGYLVLEFNVLCASDPEGVLRCGLTLADAANPTDDGTRMVVQFVQGASANQIEEVERRDTLDDIIIRDADGARIDMRQPVQVTGRALTTASACSMLVSEIRQASD